MDIEQAFYTEAGDQSKLKENLIIDYHPCSEEELGLTEGEDANIYPISEGDVSTVKKYKHLFYCFDQSQVEIMNDGSSNNFSMLTLNFFIPDDLCFNYEEDSLSCDPGVDYWKEMAHKYLIILENQKRFESDNYIDETPVVDESQLRWVHFSQSFNQIEYTIKETVIEREDNLFIEVSNLTGGED